MKQTHSLVVAYIMWFFGFLGLHRFYYNSKKMGILYFCTLGLLGVGWLFDLFYMPRLHRKAMAQENFIDGECNYTIAWALLIFLGVLGVHKVYLRSLGMALFYFLTLGGLGIGIMYDYLTLNKQIANFNLNNRK